MPILTATFTPAPPSPTPTDTPPSCSHNDLGLSGSGGRATVELAGNSIGRFRVREQFARVSLPNDAVGTTKKVAWSVVFDGSGTVLADQSKITVDLLSLISDEDERDEFLQTNSLESEKPPLAEIVVREPLGLPWPIPCQGEAVIQLVGDMTVHGVTAPLTWDATVQFRPDAVNAVFGGPFCIQAGRNCPGGTRSRVAISHDRRGPRLFVGIPIQPSWCDVQNGLQEFDQTKVITVLNVIVVEVRMTHPTVRADRDTQITRRGAKRKKNNGERVVIVWYAVSSRQHPFRVNQVASAASMSIRVVIEAA